MQESYGKVHLNADRVERVSGLARTAGKSVGGNGRKGKFLYVNYSLRRSSKPGGSPFTQIPGKGSAEPRQRIAQAWEKASLYAGSGWLLSSGVKMA